MDQEWERRSGTQVWIHWVWDTCFSFFCFCFCFNCRIIALQCCCTALVSVVQQHEQLYIHIDPLLLGSPTSAPHLTPLGHHRILSWASLCHTVASQQLPIFHLIVYICGEGNGNPLQCSCLETPRDGGAWWAAVYGVHRVGHNWSDLAAVYICQSYSFNSSHLLLPQVHFLCLPLHSCPANMFICTIFLDSIYMY